MGRIKSALIKRTAKNLLREENNFNANFDVEKGQISNSEMNEQLKSVIKGF